jgi:hypothetical protein
MPTANIEDLKAKVERWNLETTKELLPTWSFNIGMNRDLSWNSRNFHDWETYPEKKSSCIIIASAPDLKDEDLLKLREYTGDIIVCNKQFERVVRLGVRPTWCVLIDANPVSEGQFVFMVGNMQPDVRFLVSTISEPETVRTIRRNCNPAMFYMFNPHTDYGGEVAISKTWEWLNGCPTLCHGGNVGGLAFQFAKTVGYKKIGLLGFGFFEEPDPKWTMKEAGEREFFYYPDMDRTVAVPFHFLSYFNYLCASIVEWTGSTKDAEAVNISESPLMRHCPVMKQMKVGDYIGWAKEL